MHITELLLNAPRQLSLEEQVNYLVVAILIGLLFAPLNGYLINRFIPKKKMKPSHWIPRAIISVVMLATPMLFILRGFIDPSEIGWAILGREAGLAQTLAGILWTAFWVVIDLLRQKNISLKRALAPEAPQKRDGLPLWLSGILWLLTFFCIYIFPSLDQLYGYQWLGEGVYVSAFGVGIMIASGVVNVIALLFAAVILVHTLILTFTLRKLVKNSKKDDSAFPAQNDSEEITAEGPAISAEE